VFSFSFSNFGGAYIARWDPVGRDRKPVSIRLLGSGRNAQINGDPLLTAVTPPTETALHVVTPLPWRIELGEHVGE
jgi:hypothetical protein